jgi:hypothetical protein
MLALPLLLRITIASVVALGACSDDPSGQANAAASGALSACDPLAADTQPAELGHVFAVGEAPDGTLYVVSGVASPSNVDRVFVSEGGALQRRRVSGTGDRGGLSGDMDITASYEDGATASRLVVKQRANVVVGIALVHDQGRSFFDELPSNALQLKILDASKIRSLPLKNLPAEVQIEFVASAADGSQLVLTRPRDDWSYEDFRLYFGRDDKLIERKIVNASRGSNTYLTFLVDGAQYDAVFASGLSPNTESTVRGAPSGEQTLTLVHGTPSLPEGATFECLR